MGAFPWQAVAKGVGSLIGPIANIIGGNKLKKRGRNLKRSEGFDYVDPAFKENAALAKQGAYSNRSFNQGADEANLRKQVATSSYGQQQMAGSAAQRMATAGGQQNSYLNSLSQMRQKGRNERLDRVDKFASANSTLGAIRSQNEQRFWETKYSFENAGRNAIYGGISGVGNAISSSASMFGKAPEATEFRKYRKDNRD